jgi:hypothetical protein
MPRRFVVQFKLDDVIVVWSAVAYTAITSCILGIVVNCSLLRVLSVIFVVLYGSLNSANHCLTGVACVRLYIRCADIVRVNEIHLRTSSPCR